MKKNSKKTKKLLSKSELSENAEKLHNLGVELMNKSNYTEALANFQKALIISNENEFLLIKGKCLNSIGIVHYFWGDFNKYLSLALESYKIFEELKDKRGMAQSLISVTVAYGVFERFEELIKVNEKVIEIFKELNDDLGLASALGNTAIAYYELGKYDESLELSLHSLKLFQKLKIPVGEINALVNVSNLYSNLKQFEKALEYSQQAYEKSYEIGNDYECSVTLLNTGNFLISLGKIKEAKDKVQKALEIAKKNDYKEVIKDSYLSLSNIFEGEKSFEKAFVNHKLYTEIKEKIYNEQNSKEIANLRTRFETEQKEKESEIYRLKNVELVKTMNQLKEIQEKLIEAEKSKMFLAMVVTANHQLNQPLAVIQMNLDLIKSGNWEKFNDKDKKYFLSIKSSLKRCSDILTKLRILKNPKYKKYIEDLEMIDLEDNQILKDE